MRRRRALAPWPCCDAYNDTLRVSSVHNACNQWEALQALPTRAGPVGRVVMHVPVDGPAGWLPRALTHLCGARCLCRQEDRADSDAAVRPPTPPCLTSRCARRGTRPPHARARARARPQRVEAPLDPLTRRSSRLSSTAKGHGRRARASACGGPQPPRAARQLGPGALRPAQCSRGRPGGVGANGERLTSLHLSGAKKRYCQNVHVLTVPVSLMPMLIRARLQLSSPRGPVGAI